MKKNNSARRVLLVTQWFDPEPTFKDLAFAKQLRDLGWDVSVLTGFPNYPGGKIYEGYKIVPFKREKIDGIKVIRVAHYPSHDGSGLRRALNYISFSLMASLAVFFIRKPAVAYIYHPPGSIGFVAQILKIFRGTPYVYDVQDLWPDTLASTGMIKNRRVLSLVGSFMSSVYKDAGELVVLSKGFRERLLERGVPAEKISVIPNWTYEHDFNVQESLKSASNQINIVYAGNIGIAQGLEIVLEAASVLSKENVHFDFYGDGVKLQELQEDASRRELGNVTFHGRRTTSEIQKILQSADALLVHLVADPLFSVTIPSKTQAYLRSGRPILMGVHGDPADVVNEANAGLTFESSSSSDLIRAVREFALLTSDQRRTLGEAGYRYYDQNMSQSFGSRRFSEVLTRASLFRPRTLVIKRILDFSASLLLLIILAVPMIAISIAIRRNLGSPVIYSQMRPGRDGIPFKMFKFRSMTEGTNTDGSQLPDSQRLTPFGNKLRASSLDELPELWNVLKGDMSLVGPRPLLLRYTPFFRGDERLRLRVRPGITGWAQIQGRNTVKWDERLSYDVWYVKNMTVKLDFKILFQTISRVFKSEGVVVNPESVMVNLDDERSEAIK